MRRMLAAGFALVSSLMATAVQASPLFDFTISGDGHTYEFALPNPPDMYDHPHAVESFFPLTPGTGDGVSGYLFSGSLVLVSRGYPGPTLMLGIDPPTGTGSEIDLFGPPITSETFVPVAYNPIYPGSLDQDLVVSSFVPGDYGFRSLEGPMFSLTITEGSAPAMTPEPATWVMLTTGGAGGLSAMRRRAGRRERPAPAP